jgi:hypothetical protein
VCSGSPQCVAGDPSHFPTLRWINEGRAIAPSLRAAQRSDGEDEGQGGGLRPYAHNHASAPRSQFLTCITATCRAYGKSYIFEVQSFMNLVRAAPVIFCSLACFVQSAVLCFFIFASSAFFCFAAALSVVAPAGAVVVGAGVCAKLTPRLRVVAKTAALSAYVMRDMGISKS